MGVLKNKTINNDKSTAGLESLLESQIEDFNVLCLESRIDLQDEYSLILEAFNDNIECGELYNSNDILEEGLKEFGSSAARYFKMMIEKLGSIFHTLKRILDEQLMSTNDFCKKYQNEIREMEMEPFTITGYKFDIKPGIPNLGLINDLVNNYNSHLDRDLKALGDRSFNLDDFKSKMTSDDALDQLRGRILNIREVNSEDFDLECLLKFRSAEDAMDFDVDKQKVLYIINHRTESTALLNNIAREYDTAKRSLNYLSSFFESSRVVRYIDDTEKLAAAKLKVNDRHRVKATQDYSGAPVRSVVEVNKYFAILFERTKVLSNCITSALLIKSQACKDMIRQNNRILQNAIKLKPNPVMQEEKNNQKRDIKEELDQDLDDGVEESMIDITLEQDILDIGNFDYICMESINKLTKECMDILGLDEVLLEADMRTGKHKQSRINIIKIIEGFFIRIQEMLGEFLAKYGTNHSRLLKNAKNNLNAINFDKLAVTADKTFLANENKVFEVKNTNIYRSLLDPSKITRAIEKMKVDDQNGESEANTRQRFLESEICKGFISKDGSLAEGCKNYFRYGTADHRQSIKTVFKGNELQNLIVECINYCERYPDMKNVLKNIGDTARRSISNINRQFGMVEESFLGADGDILLEADMKMGTNNNNPNQDKKSQTEPPVDIPDQKQNQDSSTINDNIKNTNSNYELRVMKYVAQALQILVSSAMNVAQERYLTYIRMIKYCTQSLAVDKFTGREKKEKDNPSDMVSSNPDKTAGKNAQNIVDKIKDKVKR